MPQEFQEEEEPQEGQVDQGLQEVCIAVMLCCQSSRSYLTGRLRRFSNSNEGSTANSLPADFLKALVHLAFLGFFFFLKFLWHLDLQNLKILQSFLTKVV